jgi:hypothetical protein
MGDVQLVSDKIVQVKRLVLWVAKPENNGAAPANWFTQLKNEESRGVRNGLGRSEIASRNCHSRDRLLFSGIRILDEDGSPKRNRLLSLPADERQDAGGKQNGDKQRGPSLDFVKTSHVHIINGHLYDDGLASNVSPRCGNGGNFSP